MQNLFVFDLTGYYSNPYAINFDGKKVVIRHRICSDMQVLDIESGTELSGYFGYYTVFSQDGFLHATFNNEMICVFDSQQEEICTLKPKLFFELNYETKEELKRQKGQKWNFLKSFPMMKQGKRYT